jgi:hypothetical protein
MRVVSDELQFSENFAASVATVMHGGVEEWHRT